MPKDIIPPPPRRVAQLVALNNSRLVALCDDGSLWQRILDPHNMSGGEKFVWARVEGPPAE